MPGGRPEKPAEDRLITRTFRVPQAIWARFLAAVSPRGRSKFVREALEEKLDRDHPQQPSQQPPPE